VTLVLAAHGTRQASGVEQLQRLASAVRSELDGRTVQVGFVDVLGPTPAELLREIDGPAVVVPAPSRAGSTVPQGDRSPATDRLPCTWFLRRCNAESSPR
jgi:hypothetical protein